MAVQAVVFALVGTTLLSLVVSHPTPDYRLTKKLISDIRLGLPHDPLVTNYDFPKKETRQGFSTLLAPFAAAFLTPFVTTFTNGLTSGLAMLTGANRTSQDVEAVVLNNPESSVPYLYIKQIENNSGVPSALSSASPLVPPVVTPLAPPFDFPVAIPLPYPSLQQGNISPGQHIFSSHQILIPLLPTSEDLKDNIRCLTKENVDVPSIKSGSP